MCIESPWMECQSEAVYVTPSYTLRQTWKGSHCFPSLNKCNPFQSPTALLLRAPFLAFLYFSSVFLEFQAAILLFESTLRSFVNCWNCQKATYASEVYEHTFIFCSTNSDTLATISSRDRPVSEPCLLCRTSFIKPVNSKLTAQKRKTRRTQIIWEKKRKAWKQKRRQDKNKRETPVVSGVHFRCGSVFLCKSNFV